MKLMMILSAMFLSFANVANADMMPPSCKLNTILSFNYGTLVVPEGLTPGAQYFVYAHKWASNAQPRMVAIFTADADGKTMIDMPLEYGDYYLSFGTINKTDWGVSCTN